MSLFEKRPTPKVIDRPVDLAFMSAEEWLDFQCELYDVVAELGLAVSRIDPGVVRLSDGRSLALLQLVQHCHGRDRDDWRELMTSQLVAMTADLDDVVATPSMFDLRIRLVSDGPENRDALRHLGARPFAEGVTQLLAVDDAGVIRAVAEREIVARGWEVEEAWASARALTETLERPGEMDIVDVGGADIIYIFDQGTFTASLIKAVDRLVADIAEITPDGAIVSMPTRNSLLIHPIFDSSVCAAIGAMVPITHQLHRDGPGSLSAHLYWWRDGELIWIPTYFGDDGIDVYPPPELVDVVNELDDDYDYDYDEYDGS